MTKDIFDAATNASKTAPLQHKGKKTGGKKDVMRKLVEIPLTYCEDFETLKENGRTSLGFSAFIREALREKLDSLKNDSI